MQNFARDCPSLSAALSVVSLIGDHFFLLCAPLSCCGIHRTSPLPHSFRILLISFAEPSFSGLISSFSPPFPLTFLFLRSSYFTFVCSRQLIRGEWRNINGLHWRSIGVVHYYLVINLYIIILSRWIVKCNCKMIIT